jgi:aminopeptidase-like protein
MNAAEELRGAAIGYSEAVVLVHALRCHSQLKTLDLSDCALQPQAARLLGTLSLSYTYTYMYIRTYTHTR